MLTAGSGNALEEIMPEKIKDVKPPTGLGRLLWRAPIWLYRLHLGWLLDGRFLLLNHVGRKSGLPRRAVIEVAKYDPETQTCFVASGFGKKSDWYRNLLKTPDATIQVGRKKMRVTAVTLTPDQSAAMMVDYARRNPNAARNLCRIIGYKVDGTEEDYAIIGRDYVPFMAFKNNE